MTQLLVTLSPPGAASAELAYCMLSSSGVLSAQGHAAPALLPRTDVCTLILPAQALAWHRVDLPKLPRGISAQKMQAVLAGALEEQLLDEPAALHLALLNLPGNESPWVAACNKAWLAQSIAELQQAGVQPSSIVPQAWPKQDAQAHVTGHSSDHAQLVVSNAQGVLCWPLAHAAALEPAAETPVTAEPAVAAAAEQALQRRVQVLQASQAAVQSAEQAKALGLNLALGEFALSGSGRSLQSIGQSLRNFAFAPDWRAARWGMAGLLLAHLLGLNLWAWKQAAQVQAQRDQMQQILTSSFPNVKVVVDAPVQMQRELNALRQSQGQLSGRDFESIYARFSSVAGMNAAPNAIEYEADRVSLRGADFSAAQLEALAPKLQYANLAVSSDTQRLIVQHQAQGASK
ncbi:MAG: type II secretion system protein GspL [Brachymonas sp.]